MLKMMRFRLVLPFFLLVVGFVTPALAGVTGIAVSNDTGSVSTELLYYDPSLGFLGDSNNVTGIFRSIAAGDFDEDGEDEIVAARHIPDGCGPGVQEGDLYYYEFGASTLFYDTRNLCSLFSSVATGNFDGDPASEVVVARYFRAGTAADPFETELRFYQPNEPTQYADSRNHLGRFIAVSTGNLDADPQDEVATALIEKGGVLGFLESEFHIGEGDGTLVQDLSPNRIYDFTDIAIGSFRRGSQAANVLTTADRRNVSLRSMAEAYRADTGTATITNEYASVPQRNEGMVGIAVGNFDGDGTDDFAVITDLASVPMGLVEIYHADGISIDPSTVSFLAGPNPSRAVAVDTGDLDGDGLDEVVVLFDLLNGLSQIIAYDIALDFGLSVLSTAQPFGGTGMDLAVLEGCVDIDGDGFCADEDCDDTDENSFPGATEIPDDGIDQDCSGSDSTICFVDADGDGFGDAAGFTVLSDDTDCSDPGESPSPTDCDDADATVFPGSAETCDGQDNDCDGLVDEGFDLDGDGWTTCGGDCDDSDASVNPAASEVCDGIDNDCDGGIDEGFDSDEDGIADCFDDCPFDADNDIDVDTVCGDVDNCPDVANEDQTDFNGDGVGDACTPCEPDPRSQGYWHRQCLGVPADEGGIDPGRHGRGPQEPLEQDFDKSMDAVSWLLGDFFEFGGACAGGVDTDPASDPCEQALKQSTALLFNLATSKLSGSCTVDPPIQGCNSTNLTDLVNELESLINSDTDANCRQAAACAAAVNEGAVILESASDPEPVVEAQETVREPEPAAVSEAPAHAPRAEPVAKVSVAVETPVHSGSTRVVPLSPWQAAGPGFATPTEAQAPAEGEDDCQAMQRHLAVIANPSAPEAALATSRDALLTMLSGGYGPELRLEIIRSLLERIDVAYHGLLVVHLDAVRSEAGDSGMDDVSQTAERLLRQLEAVGK